MPGDVIEDAIYKRTQHKISELPATYAAAMSDVSTGFYTSIIAAGIKGQALQSAKRPYLTAFATAYKDIIAQEQQFRELMQQTEEWASGPKRRWNYSDAQMLKEAVKQIWAQILTYGMSPDEIQSSLEKHLKDHNWMNPTFTAAECVRKNETKS